MALIIKFSSDFQPLVKHIRRYITLYNHIYTKHIKQNTFFEVTETGMIGIYESIETFKALLSPKMKNYPRGKNLGATFFLKTIIRKKFPPNGFKILCESHTLPTEELTQLISNYFKRASPKVHVFQSGPNETTIYYPVYESIIEYLSGLFAQFPKH